VRARWLWMSSCLLFFSTAAGAQQAGTTYTVRAGDTCAGISQRAYGDARLVELIHGANPGMGPSPHRLAAGRQLVLPPKPAAKSTGPDAKLSSVRNKVEVQRPETKPGKVDDPLFRGNRVGTADASSASVLFRDETVLQLGERTLVVILGDMNTAAKKVGTAADTTLVSGALRARLAASAGKKATPVVVATKSARTTVKAGEAKVHVDPQNATRLSVYGGSSSIAAQKKSVDVSPGFGSKAEVGRAPEPPRPLPAAPTWSAAPPPLAFIGKDGTASFAGELAAPANDVVRWHLQVANDALFDDVVLDVVVPSKVRRVEARTLGIGAYHLRVSAIDDDEFEGPSATAMPVAVGRLSERVVDGKVRFDVEPAAIACAADGEPAAPAGTLSLDASRRHTLRCSLGGGSVPIVYETATVVAPPPPVADAAPPQPPAPVPEPAEPIRFDVSLALGGVVTSEGSATVGPRGVVGVGLVVPAHNVALGVRVETFIDRVSDHAPGSKLDGAPIGSASFTAVGVSAPLVLRYRELGRWEPYLGIAPGIARVSTDVQGRAASVDALRFVLGGVGGVDFTLGPGAVFGELTWRGDAALGSGAATPSLRGGAGVLGYRLRF
jgi:LysM repeat protein